MNLLNFFTEKLPAPAAVAERQLHYTELDLLTAYASLEELQAEITMLEARQRRLSQMLKDGVSK